LFSKHPVQQKNAPKRAPKWVEDVNKMAAARVLHKLVNWLISASFAIVDLIGIG